MWQSDHAPVQAQSFPINRPLPRGLSLSAAPIKANERENVDEKQLEFCFAARRVCVCVCAVCSGFHVKQFIVQLLEYV